MVEVQPLPFLRGVDPSNIPSKYLRTRPGETTEILVNEEGQPVSRLIPVERGQLDWTKVQSLPDPVYREHFGTFHPRGASGELTTGTGATSYLTVPADLPEQEAIALLQERLNQYGLHKQLATEYPRTQDIMDFLAPAAGATAGGMAGFAVAGPPGAIAGATLGGGAGALLPAATRPFLTPSRLEQPVMGEVMHGALQGAIGEGLGQTVNLGLAGIRTLGRATLIRDIDLPPDQAALFAAGGPFAQANALTGENFYPRLSVYARGPISDLDKYVSNALLARHHTQRHARGLQRNLGALISDYTSNLNATGENLPFGERMMNWLGTVDKQGNFHPGTLERGARTVQRALYDAADDIVAAQPSPTFINTQPLSNMLGQRGIGQGERSPVASAVDAKISNKLSELERRTLTRSESMTETATGEGVTISGTQSQGSRVTPQSRTATQGQSSSLTEPLELGYEQLLGTGGGNPPMPAGATELMHTERAAQSSSVRTDLPLEGWLHTLNTANGQLDPQVTIGRALQLRRAVNQARIEEQRLGSGANPEHLRLMRQFEQELDSILNPALNSVDPNLADMYNRADRFTAAMYQDLRNEVLMRDVINTVGSNPERFAELATSPHNIPTINAIRDAFYMSRHVPAGSGLPAQLSFGPTFFDNMVMPEIRFQAIRSAMPAAQRETLQRIVGRGAPIQDLIEQGRIAAPEPGTFINMRERMGEATYNTVMGGQRTGDMFIAIDRALMDAAKGMEESQKIGMVIAQFGGISSMLTGAGLAKAGRIAEGLTGLGAGGVVVFTPGIINKMLTDPEMFERVVLGIRTGMRDKALPRLLGNIASAAGRELYRPALNAPKEDER